MSNAYFPLATLTPDIYWANKQPQVAALRSLTPDTVGLAAKQLADKGFLIDVPIMVYQWDPVTVMGIRLEYGYTWVPSGNQSPVPVIPGLIFPGLPSYDPNNPPPNSIKVSIDAKDYPPFALPVVPPPQTNPVVGPHVWGNVYGNGPGATVNAALEVDGKTGGDIDQQKVTQDGVTYTAHYAVGLMGPSLYFTLP